MTRHITNTISQQFGRFASKEFPRWFQKIVNQGYVSIMGLDMSEFYAPSTYRSLNALFTRTLKASRHFSNDADDLISPCDSLITECGDLDATRALQIKGMSYCVRELLGSEINDANKERIEHGQFMNFYLSPRDYHRYHVPTNMKVLKAVHIPGKLYPVNMPSLNKRADLFIENERVVLECESQQGKLIYLVLVGALNVGKMQVSFEPRIQTNADAQQPTAYAFDDLYLKKGDDFGCFEMGSTIVMITEKAGMALSVEAGRKVRFGDTIAKLS
ncbi:phosphatidylserine decarboxylase [Sulfurimonas sp. HSL1-6]|uniref:phosphatidylserine decarboxylase n=1 Tax=Thiomicrolovo immobilis TaxID=3131935 RepID=UPI0031F85DD2